jgi:hypothetical protein
MNINDALGLGKVLPIDKLIEVVSKAVGRISKPYFDRKDIDTKVYEIKKIAEARAEEIRVISTAIKEHYHLTGGVEYKDEKLAISSPKDFPSLSLVSLEERTKERVNYQEVKKQFNIESITSYAAEELKSDDPITDEPLDDDWTTRFFKIVEDISNEEMQALWGKILAGEIKQPKSYSLRTLELIRNLSRAEAATFSKVANYAIRDGNKNYLFKGRGKILAEKYKIKYSEIASLIEVGLLQPGDFVQLQIPTQPTDNKKVYISGSIVIITTVKANTQTIQIPVYVFSNAGNELLTLIKANQPIDYLASFAKSMKQEGVEVKYGSIVSQDGDKITHTLPLQEFSEVSEGKG